MTELIDTLVRHTVAQHLGVHPKGIHGRDRTADLGLLPLDLVMIALRIEDLEGRAFPFQGLEHVHTVAHLIELVRRMHATRPRRWRRQDFGLHGHESSTARRPSWLRRMVA